MSSVPVASAPFESFSELHQRLGAVPLWRILIDPPVGTATVDDVIRLADGREKRLCELIDGVLVEKPMGRECLPPEPDTAAALHERLGYVPLERILMDPPPGMATVEDVIRHCDALDKRLCELIDGVLVEKSMGHEESRLAMRLGQWLLNFLDENDLGILGGSDGPVELHSGRVRMPDVAFISYDQLPENADLGTLVPDWVPSLAVEVLSKSNTEAEMSLKLQDYFAAGVQVVWYANPRSRTVTVYEAPDSFTVLTDDDVIHGGTLLPGFELSVGKWFDSVRKGRPAN